MVSRRLGILMRTCRLCPLHLKVCSASAHQRYNTSTGNLILRFRNILKITLSATTLCSLNSLIKSNLLLRTSSKSLTFHAHHREGIASHTVQTQSGSCLQRSPSPRRQGPVSDLLALPRITAEPLARCGPLSAVSPNNLNFALLARFWRCSSKWKIKSLSFALSIISIVNLL